MRPPRSLLRQFYAQLDAALAEFEAQYPQFLCPEGCCECCLFAPPFLLSLAEYEFLADYARRNLSLTDLARIRAAAEEQAQTYEFAEVVAAEEDPAVRERLPRTRCPFLEGGLCSVYSARPLACRMFGRTIFTSGPEAGRFNGCAILMEAAQPVLTGQTLKIHSADSLRQKIINLSVLIRMQGGVAAFNTLPKFIAELGFSWSERDLLQNFSGAVFWPEQPFPGQPFSHTW